MLAIAGALKEHGLADEQIKFELFASGQPGRAKKRVVSDRGLDLELAPRRRSRSTARTRTFRMPKAGKSLLDAALEANIDAPYACKAGVCSTCRAKVLEGETEMAIEPRARGLRGHAGLRAHLPVLPAERQGRRQLRPVREEP